MYFLELVPGYGAFLPPGVLSFLYIFLFFSSIYNKINT